MKNAFAELKSFNEWWGNTSPTPIKKKKPKKSKK